MLAYSKLFKGAFFSIYCLSGLLSVWTNQASAYTYVNTDSTVSASNLLINPQNGGTVMYSSDPQFLDVQSWAMAQNSLGEFQADPKSQNAFTNLTSDAAVTWVNYAHGESLWSTASVAAKSNVEIPPHEKMRWAYGEGRGSLGQWFQITNPTIPSITTPTSFSLSYTGSLYGRADDDSYFKTEIIVGLQLFDTNGIQLIGKTFDQILQGGPNQVLGPVTVNGTLSDTVTLDYDAWYYAYFEADSETRGEVPEPPALLLFLPGLALLARRHKCYAC